jgi:hypothetical protein
VALDIRRLTQIMGMTDSAGDGEALNAVRLANKMLKAEGKTWADVIRGPPLTVKTERAPDFRTPPSQRRGTARYGRAQSQARHEDGIRHDDSEIETWISELGTRRLDMSTMMLVASIREQWEKKGWVTTPQRDALLGLLRRNDWREGWRF